MALRTKQYSPDLSDSVLEAASSEIGEMRVQLPGIVEKYDPTEQSVEVKVALTDTDGTEIPPHIRVPVKFPRGGGFSMTWPISRGDEGWLCYADRDIDDFLERGESRTQPVNPRRFDWSDAVFEPCKLSFADPIPGVSNNYIELKKEDGTVSIQIRDDKRIIISADTEVLLGDSGATDLVALASLVKTFLDDCKSQYNAHTHGGAVPFPPVGSEDITAGTAVAATKVKAI